MIQYDKTYFQKRLLLVQLFWNKYESKEKKKRDFGLNDFEKPIQRNKENRTEYTWSILFKNQYVSFLSFLPLTCV
jgi:hypothetical protein